MIGKVAGRIDYIADDHVLIEAMGVGYEVYCSARTLAKLPRAGEAAALYTQMLVREDLMQLFGFLQKEIQSCKAQGNSMRCLVNEQRVVN